MRNETITFTHNKQHKSWTFEHNLADYGLTLESAFINWSAREKVFTPESFCEYVISKDPKNLTCTITTTK